MLKIRMFGHACVLSQQEIKFWTFFGGGAPPHLTPHTKKAIYNPNPVKQLDTDAVIFYDSIC